MKYEIVVRKEKGKIWFCIQKRGREMNKDNFTPAIEQWSHVWINTEENSILEQTSRQIRRCLIVRRSFEI